MADTSKKNSAIVSKRRDQREFRRILAPLACLVAIIMGVFLMVPAVSMTRGELVCGMEEHTHSKACYEQVLVCGMEEGEGAKPATDDEPAVEGHKHTKDCYEKQLVCDKPEHKHVDSCYAAPEPEDSGKDASAGTDNGSNDYENGKTAGEDGDKISSQDANIENVEDDNQNEDVSSDEGESDDEAFDGEDVTTFAADLKDKDGKAVLTVSVRAPKGALPENVTMKIDGIDAKKVWEPVQAAVKRGAAEDAAMQKAMKSANVTDEIALMTVVDIVFFDEAGNVVEPAKKLEVKITSDMVRDMPHPAYPFLARVTGDREAKDDDKKYEDAKLVVKKVKVVNQDEKDFTEGTEDTLKFKSDKFGPFAIMCLADAEAVDEGASGEGAETVEQVGFDGPAMNFERELVDGKGNVVLTVSADVPEGALPKGADMHAELVEDETVIDAAKEAAAGEADIEADRAEALAADITFVDAEGNPVEPAGDVRVTMTAPAVAEQDQLAVVHVDDETNAQVVQVEDVNKREQTVAFDAASFSVYALVYTVDFHWEVDGKVYEFSLPGGGFVSFRALMEALGVAKQNAPTANQPEDSANTNSSDSVDGANGADIADTADAADVAEAAETEGATDTADAANIEGAADVADTADTAEAEDAANTADAAGAEDDADAAVSPTSSDPQALNGIQVSEETMKLVADVAKVEFSNPALLWVGNVEADTTVGSLKEANELECHYSAELTDDQKREIDEQQVAAGDWALISLKAFDTEEALTVTMNDGSVFTIKVTDDADNPSVFLGKEVIIYDNTEKQAMTSNYATDYRTHFNTVDEPTADNDPKARWKIEQANGGYYLRSSDGKYLYLDHTNVRLVDNAQEATVLTIRAGTNPDYRIYAANTNNDNNALRYCENNQYPGFFSAVDGTNGAGTSREWLYIREATDPVEPAGDWLLYFDDDFSNKTITVRVGETITLRPYNKWEWKEGNTDVQTAHWNVGTWTDWSISSSDGNGSKLSKTTDGPFEFTRYVKYDDQLITHYWSVQGRAMQAGDYTLTNTKNGNTITVHVVDGAPVNQPPTINKIANIKVNLFDYDKNYLLDPAANNNLANNNNNKSDSTNLMGGSDHFYFLSSGSGDNSNEPWNSYTHAASNPNIVKSELDGEGYPVLNHGNSTSLKYLFDATQTSWHGGNNNDGMIAYPGVVGMFQKDPTTGYYYYNSNTNYYYYDAATGTSKLYEHTYTQTSSASKGSLVNDKPIGFFPFHDYDATDNLYVNQNHNLNHHVGMSMDIEFMLSEDRTDDRDEPIIFDFSGDDDLWVFVEWEEGGVKHSKLLLDLGGVHQPIHGDINFTSGSNTEFIQPNRPYTLKVFYLERGGCDSNCSIRFNLPIIQDLAVAKKLTGLTEAEKEKYKNEEFWYELVIDHKPYGEPVPYTCPNDDNPYEKATIWDADGNDVTPPGFTIQNGRFKLKDGQTLTISYLDRSDKFYVAELNTANMENFEVPNAERYYHLAQDASLYEEEITLTACQTIAEPTTDCWSTPRASDKQYELEDTEKVTFSNTLKEKNLEVEKKWIGNQTHPDSITFTVSATVDDGNGGRTPYAVAELKEEDGTTDKVFTLNDGNKWRKQIEHLPVNTPDGKFIFYDIQEGHVEGYTLTGIKDLTAEDYNYCNVDVVKLWPDSNGTHTEVLQVVLQNSAGKYYAGVNADTGEAIFVDSIDNAQIRELKPDNNYTQRYDRLPYLEEENAYKAVQLHEDEYNQGLVTYKRAIIQYELENTPLVNPVDPSDNPNPPEIHKRIDALRDGVTNPDSAHADEDLTDLYRLYLDYKIEALQDPKGVDLLLVVDHSGSMNDSHWPGNEYRAPSVMAALNGDNGLISKFLAANDKNQWAAVGFKGPDGFRDYEFDLKNPWQPSTDKACLNAGENGSEVLSPGSDSYAFTRDSSNIDLDNEGPLIQSNYTAGFWRAEQFLLKQNVKDDGRKKVVVFIADGVPTLHIDNLSGSLQDAGTAAGSPYYREEYGGCPDKALTEFGYFVNDMTINGYTFGGDNGNIDLYTIGLGPSMQTAGAASLLNGMLSSAYGQSVPTDHYMTIADPQNARDQATANKLNGDLSAILGLSHSYSNLVIQDDLSRYVDLYGLTAGSSAPAIMTAAKAKVTMTVPDPDHPAALPQVIVLYENGASADSDAAKFTKADGVTKAPIIKELQYDASTKTVKAVFDPEYRPAGDVTYTLSFDVKATDTAYTTYAADTGYDKYAEGDKQGQVIVGDPDTDFLGTNPANATSVNKPGFRSNDEAKATYKHNGVDENRVYPHPVIQVAAKVDIVKIDQTGAALEGAKFNLYNASYDKNKTIEENAGCLIEANLQSKKPTDPAGVDAVIRNGKLSAGTYYLVETEAPAGYNSLQGPVKITVAESNGILSMTAEIADVSVGDDKLQKISNGVWKLSVQNTAGYELPITGGFGAETFYFIGAALIILAGAVLMMKRRQRNAA